MSKSNLGIMLMSLAVLIFVNCGNGNTSVSYESDRMSSSSIQDVEDGSTKGDSITGAEEKTLVLYFTWSNNTRDMAQYINESIDGVLWEEQPVNAYPTSYNDTGTQAREERDTNACTEILNPLS